MIVPQGIFKPIFTLFSFISFVNEKIFQEKVQTQDLWNVRGILTNALVYIL
jgi:hypothetical protein